MIKLRTGIPLYILLLIVAPGLSWADSPADTPPAPQLHAPAKLASNHSFVVTLSYPAYTWAYEMSFKHCSMQGQNCKYSENKVPMPLPGGTTSTKIDLGGPQVGITAMFPGGSYEDWLRGIWYVRARLLTGNMGSFNTGPWSSWQRTVVGGRQAPTIVAPNENQLIVNSAVQLQFRSNIKHSRASLGNWAYEFEWQRATYNTKANNDAYYSKYGAPGKNNGPRVLGPSGPMKHWSDLDAYRVAETGGTQTVSLPFKGLRTGESTSSYQYQFRVREHYEHTDTYSEWTPWRSFVVQGPYQIKMLPGNLKLPPNVRVLGETYRVDTACRDLHKLITFDVTVRNDGGPLAMHQWSLFVMEGGGADLGSGGVWVPPLAPKAQTNVEIPVNVLKGYVPKLPGTHWLKLISGGYGHKTTTALPAITLPAGICQPTMHMRSPAGMRIQPGARMKAPSSGQQQNSGQHNTQLVAPMPMMRLK